MKNLRKANTTIKTSIKQVKRRETHKNDELTFNAKLYSKISMEP